MCYLFVSFRGWWAERERCRLSWRHPATLGGAHRSRDGAGGAMRGGNRRRCARRKRPQRPPSGQVKKSVFNPKKQEAVQGHCGCDVPLPSRFGVESLDPIHLWRMENMTNPTWRTWNMTRVASYNEVYVSFVVGYFPDFFCIIVAV